MLTGPFMILLEKRCEASALLCVPSQIHRLLPFKAYLGFHLPERSLL